MVCVNTQTGTSCNIDGSTLVVGDIIYAYPDGNDGSDTEIRWLCNTGDGPTIRYSKCLHIKLPPKVLHKIHIEINVYFMQDF